MSFMKHSVNLFLVLVIVMSVGAIAGLTLYYQSSFGESTARFTAIREEATTCATTLEQTKSELTNARAAVAANQQDVDKTVQLFQERTTELESTQETLAQANTRIDNLQASIVIRDKTISDLRAELVEKERQITSLNEEIDELEDDLDAAQDSC